MQRGASFVKWVLSVWDLSRCFGLTEPVFSLVHPADSSWGLDHLLPAGLGKAEHVRRARLLPSPFAFHVWPEADIGFVLDLICVWRDCLPGFASRQRHIITTVATALNPLEECLASCRVPSAFVAFLTPGPGPPDCW